jgi:WD40 repeat protein
LDEHKDYVLSVSINSNNRTIISSSKDNSIKIWDINTGKVLKSFYGYMDYVFSLAISPDNKTIVSSLGKFDKKIGTYKQSTIIALDISIDKKESILEKNNFSITSLAISLNSKIIVSGSSDKTITIRDYLTMKIIKVLKGHKESVNSVAITPNSKIIVSGSGSFEGKNHIINVWDINTGKVLKSLKGHMNPVVSLDVSSDNKKIISGARDGTIKVWDMKTGKMLMNFKESTDDIDSVVISSDNKTIISSRILNISATANKSIITFWDAVTGKKIQELSTFNKLISSFTLSSDKKKMILGLYDNTIKIYNLKNLSLMIIKKEKKLLEQQLQVKLNGIILKDRKDLYTKPMWSKYHPNHWLLKLEESKK